MWRRDDAEVAPRTVFVVGAGFSRAINETMPTVGQLGKAIVSRIGGHENHWLPEDVRHDLRDGRVPLGNIEQWLSFLADPPPFVDDMTAEYNSGLLSEIRDLLASEVEAAQCRTLAADMPEWLERLATLWVNTSATVVTFNYDGLVEAAVEEVCLRSELETRTNGTPSGIPYVLGGLSGARGTGWRPAPPGEILHVLKLHGSLDWFGARNDRTGATIARHPAWRGWGRRLSLSTAPQTDLPHPPFVIPPLAQKTQFYDNDLIRQVWTLARVAIEAADEVVFLGYSVPLTDFATVSLLGQWGSRNARWTVADIESGDVVARLRTLRTSAQRIDAVSAGEPIESFVDRWSSDLATGFGPRIRAKPIGVITDSAPILVNIMPGRCQRALSVDRTDDAVIITTDARLDLRGWIPDGSELVWGELRKALREIADGVESALPVLVCNQDGEGFVGGVPRADSFHNGHTYVSCVALKVLGFRHSDGYPMVMRTRSPMGDSATLGMGRRTANERDE